MAWCFDALTAWCTPVPGKSCLRGLGSRPVQAQLPRDSLHGFDAESDVLFEIQTEVGGAFDDVFAVDAAGEGFVFHFFPDGWGFDLRERFSRLDESASGYESGKFIAGEKSFFHGREARDAG